MKRAQVFREMAMAWLVAGRVCYDELYVWVAGQSTDSCVKLCVPPAGDISRQCNNLRFATEARMRTEGLAEAEAMRLELEACPAEYAEAWGGLRTLCLPPPHPRPAPVAEGGEEL